MGPLLIIITKGKKHVTSLTAYDMLFVKEGLHVCKPLRIFYNNHRITYNFPQKDWLMALDYLILKTRGGFTLVEDTSVYINNKVIILPDYYDFRVSDYENLITSCNKIEVIVYNNWNYYCSTFVYPIEMNNKILIEDDNGITYADKYFYEAEKYNT